MGILDAIGLFADLPGGDAPAAAPSPASGGWRERAAPFGLQQLAGKLGLTPDELLQRPDLVAAAVAQMEHAGSPKHVAESFLDMVDRNGGGAQGLLKTLPHYDTLLMRDARAIGNLPGGDTNSMIAGLKVDALGPTLKHLNDVRSGAAPRLLPEGYTHNFSPSAGRVVQINPKNWGNYKTPSGETVFAPHWAGPALTGGHYRNVGGEYFVPNASELGRPFKSAWASGAPASEDLPAATGTTAVAAAAPVAAPAAAASAPSAQSKLFGALMPSLVGNDQNAASQQRLRGMAAMRQASADVPEASPLLPGAKPALPNLDLSKLRALLARRAALGSASGDLGSMS